MSSEDRYTTLHVNLLFGLKCKQMRAVFKDMQQWSDEDGLAT
jgi:hypothetical protein